MAHPNDSWQPPPDCGDQFLNVENQVLRNLYQTELQLSMQLAWLTRNPRPNYTLDGQGITFTDYFKMLTEGIAAVREQIVGMTPQELLTVADPSSWGPYWGPFGGTSTN